jgi:hypothetical protein
VIIQKKESGIFTKITKTPKNSRESIAAFKELAEVTIHSALEECERAANQVLRLNGFKKYPGALPADTPQELLYALTLPPVMDAIELLREIWSVRTCLEENKAEDAALHALKAGYISTRLEVRPFEKAAGTGRKTLAFLEKRRAAKKKKGEKKYAKVIEVYNDIAESYEPDERPSELEIARQTGDHLKMSKYTVKNILSRTSKKSAK